jgi:hypothetical protein
VNIDGYLSNAQAFAGRLMTSACTVTRRSGDRVWDPTAGRYRDPAVAVYDGPCRLWFPSRTAGDVEAGGATHTISDYVVSLPLSVDVQVDDTITITASRDPSAVGLDLVVENVPVSDWQVVRKALCRRYTQEPT